MPTNADMKVIPIDGKPALTFDGFESQADNDLDQRDRINAFADNLAKKLRDAIQYRAESGIERQWSDALDLYNGRTHGDDRYELEPLKAAHRYEPSQPPKYRSTVFVQITRQKTNAASARCSDMLFPTNERNWVIEPTPVPELSKALENLGNVEVRDPGPSPTQGQILPNPDEDRPLTGGDIVNERMRMAKEAANLMQDEIDDQLTECGYNAEARRCIKDAAKLGTGILKGPIVVNKVKKSWQQKATADNQSVWDKDVKSDIRPMSKRVPIWDFYPARGTGNNVRKASFVWEREVLTRQELIELASTGDYIRETIIDCLKEEPKLISEAINYERYRHTGYVDLSRHGGYEVWTYTGEVDCEDLQAMGLDVDYEDLELAKLSAVVVMCNDRVIRIHLNPMDGHPYDVFNWEETDGSIWGVGIPTLMRYGQQTLNAAWRQMQDNAGFTHAPQVVMKRTQVTPADGDWELYGGKLWYANDDTIDVRQAFSVFQIEDNQESLQNIINLAMKFIDDETSLPMLAQGELGTAPDKVGVATLLMNNANTVLRQVVRNWDDSVTTPHISRYHDWNMEYSKREDIKSGDQNVAALGSTALMVRDQQKQDVIMVLNMAGSPIFQKYINPERLAKQAVETSSIPGVLNTKEEIKQIEMQQAKQPPPQDPRIEAEKIKAQAAMELAKLRGQAEIRSEQVEAESERMNIIQRGEQARMDDAREWEKMQMELELARLKYAQENAMTLAELKAELTMFAMGERAKQQSEERQMGFEQQGKDVDYVRKVADDERGHERQEQSAVGSYARERDAKERDFEHEKELMKSMPPPKGGSSK